MKELPHNKSSTLPKMAERPKVSFGPVFEKYRTMPGKQKDLKQTKHKAKGYFTPNPGKDFYN